MAEGIRGLAEEPRSQGVQRLKGSAAGALRIRVASYRIVYEIHDRDLPVLAVNVAPRGDVYR